MSVSAPCDPVAPSTNTGYTVSSVELFAVTVKFVASVAVTFVKQEPSPQNLVASKTPVDFVAVATPARVTLKELSPSIQ